MEGKWVYVICNVTSRPANGDAPPKRVWFEYELLVDEYRDFQEDAGRTGKGIVRFYCREGGHRTIDVEDIISVSVTKPSKS